MRKEKLKLLKKMQLVIQPIFFNNLVNGEALVRLDKESDSAVSAFEIINNHMLHKELDLFVTEEVCKFIKLYGLGNNISVNLCLDTVLDIKAIEKIIEVVERYNIDKSLISFEVNENLYVSDVVSKNVQYLAKDGFGILLDDFGVTCCSISQLKNLEADIVKIDRSIIQDIHCNNSTVIILKNIINMLKEMKKRVIIEGVETEEQKKIIDEIVEEKGLQGFLLSKPLFPHEFVLVAG